MLDFLDLLYGSASDMVELDAMPSAGLSGADHTGEKNSKNGRIVHDDDTHEERVKAIRLIDLLKN